MQRNAEKRIEIFNAKAQRRKGTQREVRCQVNCVDPAGETSLGDGVRAIYQMEASGAGVGNSGSCGYCREAQRSYYTLAVSITDFIKGGVSG
jgi:hypothetical protein